MLSGVLPADEDEKILIPLPWTENRSSLEIRIRRSFLKALGHDHVFLRQIVRADTAAQAERYAIVRHICRGTSSLVVVDQGEAEKDRNEVQSTMLGDKVLDADRYPQITINLPEFAPDAKG